MATVSVANRSLPTRPSAAAATSRPSTMARAGRQVEPVSRVPDPRVGVVEHPDRRTPEQERDGDHTEYGAGEGDEGRSRATQDARQHGNQCGGRHRGHGRSRESRGLPLPPVEGRLARGRREYGPSRHGATAHDADCIGRRCRSPERPRRVRRRTAPLRGVGAAFASALGGCNRLRRAERPSRHSCVPGRRSCARRPAAAGSRSPSRRPGCRTSHWAAAAGRSAAP